MRIRRLLQGKYAVLAVCDSRGSCTLLEFLDELGANFGKDRDSMLQLLERVSIDGPPRNVDISHQIDGNIFEFIKGRLRVFYFYDAGKMIICTHGIVKKSQKTPVTDIQRARNAREEYLHAKSIKALEIEEDQ